MERMERRTPVTFGLFLNVLNGATRLNDWNDLTWGLESLDNLEPWNRAYARLTPHVKKSFSA